MPRLSIVRKCVAPCHVKTPLDWHRMDTAIEIAQ